MDQAKVHFEVVVDQNIPQSGHRNQSPGQRFRYEVVPEKQLKNIFVVLRRTEVQIRNDVIADVDDSLDGDLHVSFSAVTDRRIVKKYVRIK